MRAVACVRAKRIRHIGERLLQIVFKALGIRHSRRNLTHPVHIVRHTDKFGRHFPLGQGDKGIPYHGGAHNLAKGANMRQARGAITRLKHHGSLTAIYPAFFLNIQTFENLPRLFKRPSFRTHMKLVRHRDISA